MQTTERTTQSRQISSCFGRAFKKKDAPKHLYKSITEKGSFFKREQIFVVRKVVQTSEDN